jgi:glycosyltransferase involved in cell wall biosynthesis
MSELVSIYLPTKNRLSMLVEAVESVLKQSYSNFELIVVDDGSDLDCSKKIKELLLLDSRISIIRNEESKGACHARNLAIDKSSGFYITGIDDDDTWTPDRLSIFMENAHYLDNDYSFLYADDEIFNLKNNYSKKLFKLPFFSEYLFQCKNIVGNQIFAKATVVKDCRFDQDLVAAQDYDLFFRIYKKYGKAKKINKVTQKVNVEHGVNQISYSRKRLKGYYNCTVKHKNMLCKSAWKYRLYSIYLDRKKKSGLRTKLILLTPINLVRYLKNRDW